MFIPSHFPFSLLSKMFLLKLIYLYPVYLYRCSFIYYERQSASALKIFVLRAEVSSSFPTHIRVEDPGKLEGNTVFTYLDAFCRPEYFAEFLPEYSDLDELKAHYQRGGLGDMKVKRFLNNVLQAELEPIRNRRKEFSKDIPAVYEMLKKGSEKAEAVAAQTLAEVKAAMKINYFDDTELIKAQSEQFAE